MRSHSRHTITNIQFKLVTIKLFEIAIYNFFGSMENINENFEFVISKSMHEPPSPLKHVFCFIIL